VCAWQLWRAGGASARAVLRARPPRLALRSPPFRALPALRHRATRRRHCIAATASLSPPVTRHPSRRRIPSKRFVEEGRLDAEQRAALLLRSGVSPEQLAAASRAASELWVERHESNTLDTFGLHPDDLLDDDDDGGYDRGRGYAAAGGGGGGSNGGAHDGGGYGGAPLEYGGNAGRESLAQTWYPQPPAQQPVISGRRR
jgi:hypothetical protein